MSIKEKNPFIGRRVIVRTYSAGVHAGTLVKAYGGECHLKDALRIWSWEGGLSLSEVAMKGITGGRLNTATEIYLVNAVEYIPFTDEAEISFKKFIE